MSSKELAKAADDFHHGCDNGNSSAIDESLNNMREIISDKIDYSNEPVSEKNNSNTLQQTDKED